MLAGRNAFSAAFKEVGQKFWSQSMMVVVSVPAEYMGDVMSDLQGRRGMIMGMESEKGFEKFESTCSFERNVFLFYDIKFNYRRACSFTMKFGSYELVPSEVR